MTQFETGKTYTMRFIGDSDLKVPVEILKRTKKFVTIKISNEAPVRVGVYEYDGSEKARPYGTYSMCPSISADRP